MKSDLQKTQGAIGDRIMAAFDAFTEHCKRDPEEKLLEAAINGGEHEYRIQEAFCHNLDSTLSSDYSAFVNRSVKIEKYIPDILIGDSRDELIGLIEVKSPMTNHNGVKDKTEDKKGKPGHLRKDSQSLAAGIRQGALYAFELVTLIEVYGGIGGTESHHGKSITSYEKYIREKFGIRWPTRYDYTCEGGRAEVNSTLYSLVLKRVKGWVRIALPLKTPNIQAYLDCGLFRLE